MAHLDEYELLSDRQLAFRKGQSCETQLTTVINDWAKILDNRGQVDIDCRPKKTLLPPPGNFADMVYLKDKSFLHRIRDVCTL